MNSRSSVEAPALPLVITPIGLCKHRDRFCPHSEQTYRHVRDMGYNAVIFGFLDQWDEDLSFLEFYGRSEAVPGLIPAEYREKNRAELRRRLDTTTGLGLSVYMSIASPLGPKSKMSLDNRDPMQSGGSYPGGFCSDRRAEFGRYLGPDEELCVGHPEVRRYYRELIADIVASFPEIRGFAIFGGDFYSSMCRTGACPRCGSNPEWRRFAEWVDEITRAARAVRPGIEMYIINWPWWQETFDILDVTDPSIGFVLSASWGFRFGEHGDRYPSLTPNWWMYDANSGQTPLAAGERPRTLGELRDCWSTIGPAGAKMLRFVKQARRQGRAGRLGHHLVAPADELAGHDVAGGLLPPRPDRAAAASRTPAPARPDRSRRLPAGGLAGVGEEPGRRHSRLLNRAGAMRTRCGQGGGRSPRRMRLPSGLRRTRPVLPHPGSADVRGRTRPPRGAPGGY